MWFFLSLLSAFFETAKDTSGKHSVTKTDEYTAAIALHIFTLLATIPFLILSEIPQLETSFWLGSLAFLFITPAWTLLYMKALKLSPLSTTLPMMAFNPIFTALLAFLFQGDIPDASGWIGILLISVGIYFVHAKSIHMKHIGSTLTSMFADKGALAMLGVAFLWSLGAHFSKMRVDGSSAVFSTFTGGIIGIGTTILLSLALRKPISFAVMRKNFKSLSLMSLFYYLATLTSNIALSTGSTAYVFSVKRGSILFSAIAGKLFFQEHFTLYKYIGLVLVGVGILAISL